MRVLGCSFGGLGRGGGDGGGLRGGGLGGRHLRLVLKALERRYESLAERQHQLLVSELYVSVQKLLKDLAALHKLLPGQALPTADAGLSPQASQVGGVL